MKTFLLLLAVASLAIGKTPPNILLIYTDDHAQWAVGAYGNEDIHTPTMDRLAGEGMRFTQRFTKPVCSPSRAMVLTGLYTHRLGIPDFIAYGNPVKEDVGLPAGTTTIASMLKQRGYATGLVGKWHLGYGPKYYPTRFGFDHAEGYRHIAPGKDPRGVGQIPFMVDVKEVPRFRYATNHTDVLADRAIRFIEKHREEPFFLFFSIYLPHLPWGAIPDADKAHYFDKDLTLPKTDVIDRKQLLDLTRLYYANITCADRNIGRVLNRLNELKLADNTIAIFIGDNGFMVGIPAKQRPKVDGRSMLPLLKDKSTDWRNAWIDTYDMVHLGNNGEVPHMRMIRTDDWKLVLYHDATGAPLAAGKRHELFNLRRDPDERRNLYSSIFFADIRQRLERHLHSWMNQMELK